MALYKYDGNVGKSSSEEFDKTYSPATKCPHSGIYRCEGCGKEIAANQGDPLPPQNHHQHNTGLGPIKWRMTVYAQHQK